MAEQNEQKKQTLLLTRFLSKRFRFHYMIVVVIVKGNQFIINILECKM